MQIDLRTLAPNPMRDFVIDPIDDTVVDNLRHSIEEDGFWGGIVCRQLPDGTIQIGAGQHRVHAALAAGYTTVDAFVAQDMNDATMVRVYARENATQRGTTSTALAGTIASAIRFLLKDVLTEGTSAEFCRGSRDVDTMLGHLVSGRGIGRDSILDFLKDVPGINQYTVEHQLANLKASGDYARITAEVQQEIEQENQAALVALAEAEAERERLEQERVEAEERARAAEAERKDAAARARAAREEAEKRRQAEAAKAAEIARDRARAEEQLAARRRRERDEQLKGFERLRQTRDTGRAAAAKAKEQPKIFDFEGVAHHLKTAHQVNVFRQVVTGPGLRDTIRIEDQAALAQEVVNAARREERELSGAFIREVIQATYFKAQTDGRAFDREALQSTIKDDPYRRAIDLEATFAHHTAFMASTAVDLMTLLKHWPETRTFPITQEFRQALQTVRQVLNKFSDYL
jgi:hypothetical protein